jgi:predicted ATPase/DNA-binding CsgD family transcriptional regulator
MDTRNDLAAALASIARLTPPTGPEPSFDHLVRLNSLESAPSLMPGGLPVPASSFVGREQVVAEVSRLLSTARLVTLTGPGGCGKTRLSLEVARRLKARFDDGVSFISLASLDDPGLVVQAVARALRVRERSTEPDWTTVALALGGKRLLLVIDSLEHLLDAAGLFAAWLSTCPGLTMLATSRERLRLQGESVYPVPPLGLPPVGDSGGDAADIVNSEAVHLFVERAQAIDPGFALTRRTAPVVAEICQRLDGLPLAIELAAARVSLFPPDAMLSRLNGTANTAPLELLSGGARDLPVRQQTLRRTIAWSYELLDPAERGLFRRLAVFVGGFTLEQAAAICDEGASGELRGESDVARFSQRSTRHSLLVLVASLLERSLLLPIEGVESEPRFGVLATIRDFARELLESSGESAEAHRRHAEYYLGLAEKAAPQLHGSRQVEWLDRLDVEHGDLRAAMSWCAEHNLPMALRLGGALWRFWQVRGHVREGRTWLERMIEADRATHSKAPRSDRASALNAAAFLAFMAGDYSLAVVRHRETLAIRRKLGDHEGVAESLNSLGLVLRCLGDYDGADALFEEALSASRALGSRGREANILNNQARSAYYRDDHAAAQALHEQALAVGREARDAWAVAICLGDLGDVYQARGDVEAACRLYEESLAAWRDLGDLRGVAQCLEGFAGLVVASQPRRAVQLFGAATAVRETICEPCSPVRRAGLDRMVKRACEVLTPEQFAEAWSEGQAMAPERAIEYARDRAVSVLSPARSSGAAVVAGRGTLTRREVEVVRLAAEGQSNREIAAALVLSERTVGTHLEHIYAKLGVSSRTAVAAYVFRHGLT